MRRVVGTFLGPIGNGGISGGDRHCLEVWAAWVKRETAEVSVLTCVDGASLAKAFGYGEIEMRAVEDRRSEVGVTRIGYVGRAYDAWRYIRLARTRCDVAYASSSYYYDLLPAVALRSANPHSKLVACLFHLIPPPWKRSGNLLSNSLSWLEQRLMILVLKWFADIVVVDNPELVEDLAKRGIERRRLFLSRMGTPEGRVLTSSAKRFDAIYVGRLSERKGIADLIRAWKLVTTKSPSATLALVGNEDGTTDCESMIHDLGLRGNVTIFRRLSDQAVRERLSEARLFVTASREEGYGLSVLEALASGLPCVTFDLPAFRWAFPQGRWIAFEWNVDALSHAVLTLLRDTELYESLAETVRSIPIASWNDVAGDIWKTIQS